MYMVTEHRGRATQTVRAGDLVAPAAGPGELVGILYRCHALRLIRMAVLLVGDQPSAEDVVQDAFLGLHRGAGRLHDPANAVAYLRASVLNNQLHVL